MLNRNLSNTPRPLSRYAITLLVFLSFLVTGAAFVAVTSSNNGRQDSVDLTATFFSERNAAFLQDDKCQFSCLRGLAPDDSENAVIDFLSKNKAVATIVPVFGSDELYQFFPSNSLYPLAKRETDVVIQLQKGSVHSISVGPIFLCPATLFSVLGSPSRLYDWNETFEMHYDERRLIAYGIWGQPSHVASFVAVGSVGYSTLR